MVPAPTTDIFFISILFSDCKIRKEHLTAAYRQAGSLPLRPHPPSAPSPKGEGQRNGIGFKGSHALFDYWSFVIKHFSKRTFAQYSTIDDVED